MEIYKFTYKPVFKETFENSKNIRQVLKPNVFFKYNLHWNRQIKLIFNLLYKKYYYMAFFNHCCFGMFIFFIFGIVNLYIYFNENRSSVILTIGILFMVGSVISYPIYYYIIYKISLKNDYYIKI